METLLLIVVVPLIWMFIAKHIWSTTINYQEMVMVGVITALIVVGVWQIGTYSQTRDTEIWNGQITKKTRVEDSYVRSYSCNCHTSCSGSGSSRSCTQHCQTCYEDHYTVDWNGYSTVGNFKFKSLDSLSRSVYRTPDPVSFARCKVGEPASRPHSYPNYVKAVPESLFHDDSKSAEKDFKGKIPSYPRVYEFYKINRVINVGGVVPASTVKDLNVRLSNMLRTVGPARQANLIVILTNIQDPSYRYAIESAWLSGKKNDIILLIGVKDNKITWTDVITWALNSGNELFHVKVRDGVKDIGVVDPEKLTAFMKTSITKLYDRPHMEDYEYLKDSIEPPLWAIILAIVLALGSGAGLTYYFHKHEVDILGDIRSRFRRK